MGVKAASHSINPGLSDSCRMGDKKIVYNYVVTCIHLLHLCEDQSCTHAVTAKTSGQLTKHLSVLVLIILLPRFCIFVGMLNQQPVNTLFLINIFCYIWGKKKF